jgi:hypothetical protein
MEKINLDFDYVVGMFNNAAECIKQLRLEREFLEKEIKELREELENVPRGTDRGILKPEEAKDFIFNFLSEGFDVSGLVAQCEESCNLVSEEYGDKQIRVDISIDEYSIEEMVTRLVKRNVNQLFEECGDKIIVLDGLHTLVEVNG